MNCSRLDRRMLFQRTAKSCAIREPTIWQKMPLISISCTRAEGFEVEDFSSLENFFEFLMMSIGSRELGDRWVQLGRKLKTRANWQRMDPRSAA